MSVRAVIVISAVAILTQAAPAQLSNVTAASKRSWGENIGWMNWRDAGEPSGSQGVLAGSTVMAGFVWCENAGWLNLGDGAPATGMWYANLTGADFGVNIDPGNGALSGLAWGENIGWVNFSVEVLPAAQRPRLDRDAKRLRGYAWGENVGWINLDSDEPGTFVGVRTCVADFNGDGNLDPDDLGDYINCYFSIPACELADFNADGNVDPDDLRDFINAYFNGCD